MTALLTAAEPDDKQSSRYEFLQIRMGIPVSIVVYAPDEATANEAAGAAYDRLRALDRLLSDYDPDSELMQLCSRATPGVPYSIGPDLHRVLLAAQKTAQQSEGAFDVTVGPLVKLWRVARRKKLPPEAELLRDARSRTGWTLLQVNPDQREVTFQRAGMQLDLGGIAKGYAADEALRVLREMGCESALVEAGGDITVGDPPPQRTHWNIDVEPRSSPDARPASTRIRLTQQAVATSGDTYQFVEINGQRYSHLIDPQTGLGLSVPSSVTVVAPTGMQADALASAVSVLGPEKGIPLLESLPDIAGRITVLTAGGEPCVTSTRSWSELLDPVPGMEEPR